MYFMLQVVFCEVVTLCMKQNKNRKQLSYMFDATKTSEGLVIFLVLQNDDVT